MSSKGHTKKKNTGLLYEFLVAHISKSLVAGDEDVATHTTNILKNSFRKGTEINKEFKLIQSLYKSKFSSEQIALNFINDAKNSIKFIDENRIDAEKNKLLEEISKLNDVYFFDHPVSDYKILATIYTLINEWKKPFTENFVRKAEFEQTLVKHLLRKDEPIIESVSKEEIPGMSRLVFRLMTGKVNQKWSNLLPEQKEIIRNWIFRSESKTPVSEKLHLIKEEALKSIDVYNTEFSGNVFVKEKVEEIKTLLEAENIENPDDEMIARFMLYVKLISEIKSEDQNE